MYNTKYVCKKQFKVYLHDTQQEFIVRRNSKWNLVWCGGSKSFKELYDGKMTLQLPDDYVSKFFKKI